MAAPASTQITHSETQAKKPAVNSGRLPYAAGSRDGARSEESGAALIAAKKWTKRAPGAIGGGRG